MYAIKAACAGLATLAVVAGCNASAGSSPVSVSSSRLPPNNALSSAVSTCLRLKDPAAGVPAYAADGERLPFEVFAGHEPGTDPRCAGDELRVLRLAALRIDGQLTYVRRGGCRTPCVVRQATVHVPASAFAAPLELLAGAARNGDGRPLADCRTTLRSAPQLAGRDLARMFYKRPTEAPGGRPISPDVGARWSNYGDPGALYRPGSGRSGEYGYLLWNLPRTARGVLHGGGIVEAVVARGAPIERCSAPPLTLAAFDSRGAPDGDVEFAYAELRLGSRAAIYGWALLGYTYRGHYQSTTT